ncbi:hypothetical protein VCEM1676A_003717 [Vibrio cholerae O1 str. EM-1676A]|nr:hypothetical protein VCEM1676A_003717 [Vibrio cholerae O1 str. EM-1676A]
MNSYLAFLIFLIKRIPSQIIFSVQEIAQQNKYCHHKG